MPSCFLSLLSEAKPWIQKTKVTPLSHPGKFRIYQNESTFIIITGPGKIAMAIAVSEFASLLSKETRNQMKIWNLGIAGSNDPETKIGDFFGSIKLEIMRRGKIIIPNEFYLLPIIRKRT